ncbi:MAG: hemolysin III family protein [Acidimicrobiia bacterium]
MDRLTLGKMQNPIRGFLHGGAAVATVVGLVFLIIRAWGSAAALVGALVFGLALLVMYTVSSLYHSIPWGKTWKTRLQRVDHSMIYLVVAGTFTPVAIAVLDGVSLAVGLSVLWVIAATGIVLKSLLPNVKTWLSVSLQLSMGWIALAWVPGIVDELGLGALVLILLGGLLYTVGAVIFLTKWPKLLPRSFSYHELFHVFVITASVLHFMAIWLYAIPATT